MKPMKVGGLALATSISAIFNFLALYILLEKRLGDLGTRSVAVSFMKATFAGAAMKGSRVFLRGSRQGGA